MLLLEETGVVVEMLKESAAVEVIWSHHGGPGPSSRPYLPARNLRAVVAGMLQKDASRTIFVT